MIKTTKKKKRLLEKGKTTTLFKNGEITKARAHVVLM